MVDFCDECGAILISTKGKNVTCPACGKVNKIKTGKTIVTESINSNNLDIKE